MAVLHAWRLGDAFTRDQRRIELDVGYDFLKHLDSDAAGTQDGDAVVAVTFDDRRFDADVAGTAVDDHVDAAVHVVHDFFGRRRAGPGRQVGAGTGYGDAGTAQEGPADIVVRAAQGYRIEAARRRIRHDGLARQDDGQRSRPEAVHELLCRRRDDSRCLAGSFFVGHGQDERVIAGPAFGDVNTAAGVGVEAIGTDAVNRFRRKDDQAAVADDLARFFEDGFLFLYIRNFYKFRLFHRLYSFLENTRTLSMPP